jgi:DNA-directed RNA polymerase subunit alpha
LVQEIAPKVECIESGENYGSFVLEPLERGFGLTVGNAMRRVLLGSLPGAAVTAVRINGVQHEFSTIPHVKEDTTEFLLNVKAIRLRALADRPGTLHLEVAGEGEVVAGDVEPSADYEVVNPELHLATLGSAEARLSVEFTVDRGVGYVPATHTDGLPIGVIPVDAIFTPVRKVNYRVTPTRVGQMTNYDRMTLDVWTDGTITPTEAVTRAAQTLVRQFAIFGELGRPQPKAAAKVYLGGVPVPPDQYDLTIEQLELSVRTFNCLKRSGINKLGELLEKSKEELLAIRNFGQKSFEELWEKLKARGLVSEERDREETTAGVASRSGAAASEAEGTEEESDEA